MRESAGGGVEMQRRHVPYSGCAGVGIVRGNGESGERGLVRRATCAPERRHTGMGHAIISPTNPTVT